MTRPHKGKSPNARGNVRRGGCQKPEANSQTIMGLDTKKCKCPAMTHSGPYSPFVDFGRFDATKRLMRLYGLSVSHAAVVAALAGLRAGGAQ